MKSNMLILFHVCLNSSKKQQLIIKLQTEVITINYSCKPSLRNGPDIKIFMREYKYKNHIYEL